MSLHFLGLQRQASSPLSPSFSMVIQMSEALVPMSRNSKDELLQRVLNLADRIEYEDLEDDEIVRLSTDLDSMERSLHTEASPVMQKFVRLVDTSPETPSRPLLLEPPSSSNDEQVLDSSNQSTPAGSGQNMDQDDLRTEELDPPEAQKTATLIEEAQLLYTKLSTTLQELKARKEESEHIHDLLLSRAETAAQHIIVLEGEVQEIHHDLTTLLSNLSFLRIQVRALEVQGQRHIPFAADAELDTSIRNWRLEWADVDARTRRSKRRCEDVLLKNGGCSSGRGGGGGAAGGAMTQEPNVGVNVDRS